MSSSRERRISSLSVEQKVGARVSERWWPMREMRGKDRHGNPVTQEVFVDMRSGAGGEEKQVYTPENGWDGSPPNLPGGDVGREGSGLVSERYRENFSKIDWEA